MSKLTYLHIYSSYSDTHTKLGCIDTGYQSWHTYTFNNSIKYKLSTSNYWVVLYCLDNCVHTTLDIVGECNDAFRVTKKHAKMHISSVDTGYCCWVAVRGISMSFRTWHLNLCWKTIHHQSVLWLNFSNCTLDELKRIWFSILSTST